MSGLAMAGCTTQADADDPAAVLADYQQARNDGDAGTSGDGVSWDAAADASFGGTRGRILDIVETATSLGAAGVTDWDQGKTNDNHRTAVWVMERP